MCHDSLLFCAVISHTQRVVILNAKLCNPLCVWFLTSLSSVLFVSFCCVCSNMDVLCRFFFRCIVWLLIIKNSSLFSYGLSALF